MLNKNTLGVKKVRGQSEAALQTGAIKMKERRIRRKKTTAASKKFLWKEGFYKAISEDWLNRFRRTSGY